MLRCATETRVDIGIPSPGKMGTISTRHDEASLHAVVTTIWPADSGRCETSRRAIDLDWTLSNGNHH